MEIFKKSLGTTGLITFAIGYLQTVLMINTDKF